MKLFDKHHGTQFFFTLMGVIVTIAVVIVCWNQHNINEVKRQIKNTTYLYGNKFVWSVTGDPCTIVGCYRNEAQDRVAIVFKNDINAKEPLHASGYRAVIRGAYDKMQNIPKGIIYGYGDGYFALVFDSTTPFVDQIYSVLLQTNIDTSTFDANGKINDFVFNLNLGMSTMPVLDCLDNMGKEFKPEMIYTDVVLGGEFASIYESLDNMAISLGSCKIELVAQYDKLKGLGVNVPDIPYGIYHDSVTTTRQNCNKIYTSDMSSNSSTNNDRYNIYGNITSENKVDTTASENAGTATEASSENTNNGGTAHYVYFENLLPGYAVVEYHDLFASSDILSKATDMTYEEYMQFNMGYADEVESMLSITETDAYTNMRMMNGNYIEDAEINSVINLYKASLREYLNLKKQYLDLMNEMYTFEYGSDYIITDITYTENVGQID